jgi:cytochrome c-type biogenesis protein CcmH
MNNTPPLKLTISIFIALILVALVGYFAIAQLPDPVTEDPMSEFKTPQSATAAPNNQASTAGLDSVEVMLVGLKQRLESQPEDIDGWILLSKSYFHVNRQKQAKEAYDKAMSLGYKGSWKPLPRIDSYSQSNLSTQKYESAINTQDYKTGQPTDTRAGETSDQAGTTNANGLKLHVALKPGLIKNLSPESPVFVFVRSAENPGPPLAVIRKQVADLPFEVVLNDSHAMIPGKTISNATNVIVGARISSSGNVEKQAGDYEQLSNSIPSDFADVLELVISDQI